ncbi:hypothetical protein [Chryseobacterium sp. MP_3.2]|uniref:hypothetical protein n=1 Tax=Chryseobacterium sp. MP_3.2 TaxID=3071712 RepID=UPI002E0AB2D1|nr:hypothetical protein [Chryseobacterium sp. MP_3.2]
MAYIEEKTQQYLDELAQNDEKENSVTITKIQEKIERLKKNKLRYEVLEEKLKASGEPQISTTDEDSRALLVQGQVVEVSYNIQAAVDAQYNQRTYLRDYQEAMGLQPYEFNGIGESKWRT